MSVRRQLLCPCIKISVMIIMISLFDVPGKVYGRVLKLMLIEVTETKASEEQGGLRKGKLLVDQIFAIND